MSSGLNAFAVSPNVLGSHHPELNREGETPREPKYLGSGGASPSRLDHVPPIFPRFKPLEMSDRAEIEAFTRQFDPYSDFCFSLLTFYDCGGHTSWCWLNGNFVLRFSDSFGPGIFLTFLGNKNAAATAGRLVEYAVEMGFTPTLWRIPEVTAKAIANESDVFDIGEDRDGFDYVHALHSLVRLEGSESSALRHDVARFKKRHAPHQFVHLDFCDAATQSQLQSVMARWQSFKKDDMTAENYHSALDNCIHHADDFDLLGVGLVIGDSLEGFTMAEDVGNGWLLSHFAAANPSVCGLSGSLLHHLALLGTGFGCTNFNYQEDVGDLGLRRFKMKCAPSGFLRKFSVSRKEGCPCCS